MNKSLGAYTDMSNNVYPDYVSIEENADGEVIFHVRGAAGQMHASAKMPAASFADLVCRVVENGSDVIRSAVIEACLTALTKKLEQA